jgi:hypothetical protein
MTADRFNLRFSAPGSAMVRVRYTNHWVVARGTGCVGPSSNGWTMVRSDRAGPVTVEAGLLASEAGRCPDRRDPLLPSRPWLEQARERSRAGITVGFVDAGPLVAGGAGWAR